MVTRGVGGKRRSREGGGWRGDVERGRGRSHAGRDLEEVVIYKIEI